MKPEQEIKTVGRRRLLVRREGSNVKIDILWKDRRLATLELSAASAREMENALRRLVRKILDEAAP